MLSNFPHTIIWSPSAFTKPEIVALTGLPLFITAYRNRKRLDKKVLLGGMCLNFCLKSTGEMQTSFRGIFSGKGCYMDHLIDEEVNGFDASMKAINAHWERIRERGVGLTNLRDNNNRLAVIELDLAHIVFSCWGNEFGGADFESLVLPFVLLVKKLYADNGERWMYGSATYHLAGGNLLSEAYDIFEAYWENSPECIALRKSWDELPEDEILGKFGERLFDIEP